MGQDAGQLYCPHPLRSILRFNKGTCYGSIKEYATVQQRNTLQFNKGTYCGSTKEVLIILNPTALLFGLFSWTLAFVSAVYGYKMKHSNWLRFLIYSWCICSFSVWIPLLCTSLEIKSGDMAAVYDCTDAYNMAAIVLLIVNLLLTMISFTRNRKVM